MSFVQQQQNIGWFADGFVHHPFISSLLAYPLRVMGAGPYPAMGERQGKLRSPVWANTIAGLTQTSVGVVR